MGLGGALVDLAQQVALFHHPEPGDGAQGGADGDDIDGDDVHPGAPLGDGLHVQAEAQTDHGQNDQDRLAAQLGEAVLQRFSHGLEHILQRADAGEHHGGVQNDGKQLAEGDVLQDAGQGNEQQRGAGADIQTVGKAGGDDHQSGHHGGDGVKDGGAGSNLDHVLLVIQISAVDDHAAAGDRQGEEGLAHGPHPGHGVGQSLPPGGEDELVAFGSAGQEGHADGQHGKDDEKDRHHDLVRLFNALCAQKQGQQGDHHHDDVEGNHRVTGAGEGAEPLAGVHRHQIAGEGVEQGLEHIGDDDGIAQGDAHGAGQRQPAQPAAGAAQLFAAGGPGVAVGAQGAGAGTAADGVFGGQTHHAEQRYEDQIGHQEGKAAVGTHFCGEAPHVGHAYGRAHRRQDKAPAAGKIGTLFVHESVLLFDT